MKNLPPGLISGFIINPLDGEVQKRIMVLLSVGPKARKQERENISAQSHGTLFFTGQIVTNCVTMRIYNGQLAIEPFVDVNF